MGFLAKIFKKKPGGTFLGNMIRNVVGKYSGGILGNGGALRQWEIDNGYRDAAGNPTQAYYDYDRGSMTEEQKELAMTAVEGGLETPGVKEGIAGEVAKKAWPWVLIAVVAGVALWLFKGKQNNKMTVNNGRYKN